MGSANHNKPAAGARCRHHWMIEPPDGPTSVGVCRWCRESQEFLNVVQSDFAAGLRKKSQVDFAGSLVD